MLVKRDHPGGGVVITHEEVSTMSEIEKRAGDVWNGCIDFVQAREKCDRSRAIDICLRDATMREAFDLQRDLYLMKMGGTPHGSSSSEHFDDPHRGTRHDVSDGVAWKAYSDAVQAASAHMPASAAHDYVRTNFPHLWGAAKRATGRSPTMLPTSHDGNALRPSGTDFDQAYRHGGGRPYGRA
jgi:hypothetical protein